jgi:hypothetical protein
MKQSCLVRRVPAMLNETGGRGRSVAIALKAIGLVSAVAISLLVVFWPYVVAWLTIHEPTADERRAYFETVRHRGGVPARLARSGMRSLEGDAIARSGNHAALARAIAASRAARAALRPARTFTASFGS